MIADSDSPTEFSTRYWFLRGARTAFSTPGLILGSAFIGFASLAREAGFTTFEAVVMTGVIWALPAKVVLVGAVQSGASLLATAFAVGLSSVRLMPMVVVLMPEMRTEKTRSRVLYVLSHFVAVTSWVLALERLRTVPLPMRTTWYAGLGSALLLSSMVVVGVVGSIAGRLPTWAMAALLLLTPLYFLTSLWGSAREWASHLAMAFGLVLGPALHLLVPGFDLLIAGLVGGVAAFLCYRHFGQRSEP